MVFDSCPCGCCIVGALASQPDDLNKKISFLGFEGGLLGHFCPCSPHFVCMCVLLFFCFAFFFFFYFKLPQPRMY
ncbi:hypothetical protein AMTRI_Chr05g56940 [Amborella trichopoda]